MSTVSADIRLQDSTAMFCSDGSLGARGATGSHSAHGGGKLMGVPSVPSDCPSSASCWNDLLELSMCEMN